MLDLTRAVRDIFGGILWDIRFQRDVKESRERFRRQAIEALTPVRGDMQYIAQIHTRYCVTKERIDDLGMYPRLPEIVVPAIPLEEEVQRYHEAMDRVVAVTNQEDLAWGTISEIIDITNESLFDPEYQFPKLR